MVVETCGDGRLDHPAERGPASVFSQLIQGENANSSPAPIPPAYSDSETFQPRNQPGLARPLQSRKLQLSRTVNRSCFFHRAMTVRRLPQIHADKLRKAAASLRPPAEP